MGSQCCRCANGKKQQITDYNSENINIRFHGKHELSTIRYHIQTYGNAPNPRPKLSRIQGIFYHSPIVENFPDNYPLTDNVRKEHYRRAQMNIQNISIERQDGEPPVFIRRFTDLVAKVGTRIRFLVEIQSSPCPKVIWHRDHKEIDVAESRFSLVHEGNFYCIDIAQVRIEDEGYWTCLAENLYGRSSCTACLSVIIPRAYKKPQFVEELCALLTETGTVSLECKVVGIPTPVLKWFKDDKEIKAGDVFALTASPDDETSLGTYTCEAINCMGTAHSSSKIHVRDGDNKEYCKKSLGSLPTFKKILKDETCKIGDNLSLSCQIIVPPWPKDVTWYNKVGRIKPNEKYNIREDGLGTYSIEIKSLEAVDEGEWKCVATSLDNAKQFTTCYISMIIPKNYRIPRFMEGLKAVLTEEGLVSFECKVVGFPTPVLKWFKDGQELKPGDVYQLTGKNSLGLYCCIANNCMGEAKSTAELTIEDIEQQLNEEERLQLSKESTQVPKFIRGLKSCESMINENFTFTIQLNVLLSSEPCVSWYRNDQHIVENLKYKLIKESLDTFHIEIKKLELIDQAEWKCVAENDFGHSVTSCFLKLIIPNHFKKPKFLENLKAVFSKEGTVNLECKVIGVPQPILKWYKDGIELKPGDIHRIISGENGTCCLGIYTCEATNCMGSVSSSASLLGFEDANVNKESSKENLSLEEVARNLSLSTIHEERTSQLYDTPQTEHSLSLDDRGEVSFSFDGKEVSVSLYETPDLTEEDAIKIIEMYADQLSEHISESNVVELPPMRFVKETSTSGNLLMEAIVIDISPDYFIANEYVDDLCTEIDVEDVSIMDDQTQSIMSSYSSAVGEKPPQKPLRKKQSENGSSKSEPSEKNQQKSTPTLDLSESYYSAKELSSIQDHSLDILPSAIHTNNPSLIDNKQIINVDTIANEPDSIQIIQSSTLNNNNNNILTHNSESLVAIESKIDETTSELINYPKYSQIIEDDLSTVEEESILYESPGIIENTSIVLSKIHFALSSALEKISMSDSNVLTHNIHSQNEAIEDIEEMVCNLLSGVESLRQCVGDITVTLADPIFSQTSMPEYPSNPLSDKLVDLKVPLRYMKEIISNQKHHKEFQYILDNISSPMQELKEAIMNLSEEICIEPEVIQLLEDVMGNIFAITATESYQETEFPIDESFTALNNINIVPFNESDSESLISDLSNLKIIDADKYTTLKNEIDDTKIDASLEVKDKETPQMDANLKQRTESEIELNVKRSEQLNVWTLTLIEPLKRIANIGLSLDRSIDEQVHTLLCKPLHSLDKQIDLMASEINHPQGQSLDNDVETIIEGFLWPANQLQNAIELAADIWSETPPNSSVRENIGEFANSISDLCEQLISLRKKLIQGAPESSLQIQKADASLIETITAVLGPLQNIQNIIMLTLNNLTIEKSEENDSMPATSKKLEDIQKDNDLYCENIIETNETATNSELSLVENSEDSQNKIELQAEKFNIPGTITGETEGGELLTLSPESISAKPAPTHETSNDKDNLKLLKEAATTSIIDQTNENNNFIDKVDNIGGLASLDREENVTSHEKVVSLEDNILNIIKDELYRQSALELATINLFECIQAKVSLIMSINADMNEPSILEEMVRDITVEELQKTKLANNENTDGLMKNESLPSESSVDVSKVNEEYNTWKEENLAEIQPSENDTRANLSDSVESAKCLNAVEIGDLCENKLLNDILTAESINNQEEIEEKMKKALAAEEISSDNTIEHEVEVLVLSELGHTFANSIDIEEYKEIIKSKCQATILNCPLASEHSISEESIGDLITNELEKQKADITQFYSHDEMKNIRATQTCIDITLEEVIKSLVTAELENSFAKMIEEQQYTDPIRSNVQLTILNNPMFAQEHISEELIGELIITELEKQKLKVIEAEADVSLIENIAIKESNAHKAPMILKSPRDMEVTVPWEISNENTAEEPEVSHQSVIVNLVNDDFASAAKNKKLILHCPQLLDEEVSDEPIEKIQSCSQEYNTDTANIHVVEDDKYKVKAEPSQLILVKAQQLEEDITDETIEGIQSNEILKYDKETVNVNLVDDNEHKIETSQPVVVDPAAYCSVDDSEPNSIVQIEEKPMMSEKPEKSETSKIDPVSDNEFVRGDDILAVTDLSTDSSIKHADSSELVMRETNIGDSESIKSSEVNQADIDDNRSFSSSQNLQTEIDLGEDVPPIVEEKSLAVATDESLLSHKLSKESIQDIVKIGIHNATSEECSFKDIDIDLITNDIQERLTTIPKEFDANDLKEHAKRMVREKLIEVKMESEKGTREKLRKKSTRKSPKNKKGNSSDKDDNESKTELIEVGTINDGQNEILIKKQQAENYSKEITDAKDSIQKQKEVEKMPHEEENHQVFDVETSSREKITALKEDNIEERGKVKEIRYKEENDQSLNIETLRPEKITALKEDNIEEQKKVGKIPDKEENHQNVEERKKVEEIRYKEEKDQSLNIETSRPEKITALKEDNIEEQEKVGKIPDKEENHQNVEKRKKVEEIQYKKEKDQSLDIETLSHGKITALREDNIEEQKKVGKIPDKEVKDQSLDIETSSHGKTTALEEDDMKEQKKLKDIRYKEENDQSMNIETSSQEKITASNKDNIEEQKKVDEVLYKEKNLGAGDIEMSSHEKITALKEDTIEKRTQVQDTCYKEKTHESRDTETSSHEKITALNEDNIEEQKKMEEILYKEENLGAADIEMSSHEKITASKGDAIEERKQVQDTCDKKTIHESRDIETSSRDKITPLKGDSIEELKKLEGILHKEENFEAVDIEMSSHEKITALKEDTREKRRQVQDTCDKEKTHESRDIETSSHDKVAPLKGDSIEEQKKVDEIPNKEENLGAADIEASSHEKITALKKNAIEEREKVKEIRDKEENNESLNDKTPSDEKITGRKEDMIEEQKKIKDIRYKEGNHQSSDVETASHEKITTRKEDAIGGQEKVKEIRDKEENNKSLDDKTPSDEKITGRKEDMIEEQKKVKDIRYENEKHQSLDTGTSDQEKITALKEDALGEQEKVKEIRDKEENNRSLDDKTPSDEKITGLKKDMIGEQKKVKDIRYENEKHQSLDTETSGQEKITALAEDAIGEQKKVKEIRDKEENYRALDTETSSQEKNTALKEDEAVNLSIEGKMPREAVMFKNSEEKKQSEDTPMKRLGEQEIKLNDGDLTSQNLSSQCKNKLLEQEKPERVVKEYCADVNIENQQIEEKQNIFELEKDGTRKLPERYEKRVVDDGKSDKIKLEKDYDDDMSLECSQNSEALEESHTQEFEKTSWNKKAHMQSDPDSLSLKFNEKLRTSNERDLSANLPSISIGCDESLASDQSRYSDELHTRSRIYHPFDNEGGIASLSDYSSTRGLTTSGPRDKAKKPVFCMKLTNRNAITASRIKLTCTVLGEPEPDIIWLRNNKELEESSNRYCITNDNGIVSLEIYSLKIEDSGEYSCIATNIHGRACTEAKLKVFAGYESTPSVPIFTRAIRDKFKVNENKLILECNVKAQPPPIITWLKDEKIIRMDNRYKQSDLSDGMCRLEISNPCSDDNGTYICRAENECGFSHCTSHLIYCNNKVENYRERDTTSFRSSNINYDGTRTERFTNRPYFSSYLTNHAVPAGGTIGLQVQVESASTPEVTWLRNDTRTPIFAPKAQSFSDRNIYTLILPNASESESGTYICRASNAYGYVDSAARVEIVSRNLGENGKPAIFISRPVDKLIHAYIGEDVSLSFRTTGVPKPRVILMKGLTDITNGARAYKESHDDYVRITFKRVQISDEGTYCILVKNRYGCDRCFFTIRIKQRARSLTPSTDWNTENMENFLSYIQDANQSSFSKKVPGPISSKPVVIDGGKTWLALTWGKAEPQVTAPVTAYRVDAWLLGGDGGARWIELGITPTNSFDAFNLRPGGEYKFRVTPRNRYGWGESVVMENSVRIEEITAFPEFSKILPGQLKVLKGTTLNLSCEINSDSTTHIRWYKDSAEINTSEDSRFITNRDDSKCTLSIKDIEENDSGRYVCDATNSAGRVSTFARVQVVTDPKIVEADMNFRKMRFMDVLNDDRPPEFTMRLRDRRVQTTFPVRLTCQVRGYPEPQVTWYKSEEEIDYQVENITISKDEAHFHTLEINRAKIDDTGIYMASAENLYGSVSCRCHLVVDEGIRAYIAPEFSQHLNEIYIVNHNEELRMNAQVKAYPAVGITWYRDGKHLRPGRNTVMSLNHDGTIELTLAHMTHGDTGLYCCVAMNEVGRAESITKVQISTNFENMNSTLECLPEIAETLAIPYSKAPVFITKPLSTEAFEGDNIIIMCEVIGDPKPEVIWLRDFLRPDYYKDSPHFRRIGLGPQYRLEIPYAKLDFTGTYSVIAKNSYGEAKAVISLQIYARDLDEQKTLAGPNIKHGEILTIPVLKNSLKDIRCCDGDAVTFSCKIHAIPAPNIRWERAGKLVGLGGDITTDFDGEVARLQIEHVYPEDEGEYTCIAYNSLGNTRTSACLIVDVPEGKEVSLNRRLKKPTSLHSLSLTPISTPRLTPVRSLSPSCLKHELRSTLDGLYTQKRGYRGKIPTSPKFYVVPHNRVVEEGDTVRFQCAVAGHPMPWAHWDKDGIAIMSNARITITEKNDLKILEIVEIIYDDAGLYRITLENEIGRVQATARLEVIRGRYSLLSRGTIRKSSPEIHSAYHSSRHQYPSSSLRTSSSSILDDEYVRERAVSPIFLHKPSHHRSVNF